MMTRSLLRLSFAFVAVSSLLASAAGAKWLPVHSVWCDDRPLAVVDGDTGVAYTPSSGDSASSWQETTPQAFSHAVATTSNGLYEFRLVAVSASDNDSILGLWDIYRNGTLACNHCVGKVYLLSGAIGSYFKIYAGTPLAYAEKWHFSGYITNRFDY
jgi:hypothetical protein